MCEVTREMREYREDGPAPEMTPDEFARLYEEAMSEVPLPMPPTREELDAMFLALGEPDPFL